MYVGKSKKCAAYEWFIREDLKEGKRSAKLSFLV